MDMLLQPDGLAPDDSEDLSLHAGGVGDDSILERSACVHGDAAWNPLRCSRGDRRHDPQPLDAPNPVALGLTPEKQLALAGDCLALATGIFPRRPPSPSDTARAAKVIARAQTAVRAFLKAEKAEPWEAWKRPPDQEELHAQLCSPVDTDGWDAGHLPPVVYPAWLMTVNAARKYVADRWPIFDAEGLTPANYALSSDEYGDVWELVRAVDGEENMFADLRSHVLTPAMVDAVKACYPDFYQALDRIVFEELATLARQKKQLTWQQEDMVRVLRGLPDEAPITVAQPSPPTPQQNRSARPGRSAEQARTRNERIEAGESR